MKLAPRQFACSMLIIALLTTPLYAQTRRQALASQPQTGDSRCNTTCGLPNLPEKMKRLIIDASNMSTQGDVTYDKGDRVQIVLMNKNPYRFKYTITTTETTVQETALTTFLPFLGSLIGDVVSPPKPAAPAAGASPPERLTPTPCEQQLAAILTQLEDDKVLLGNRLDKAIDDLRSLETQHKPGREKYEATRITLYNSTGANCSDLCGASYGFLDALQNIVRPAQLESIQADLEKIKSLANVMEIRIEDARSHLAECIDPQRGYFRDTLLYVQGVKASLNNLQGKINTIKDDLAKFDVLKKAIDSVLGNKNAFVETVDVGPFTRTTEVKVDVTSKEIAAQDNKPGEEKPGPSKSVKLKFGQGPFFSISGGVVFARLVKREFQRVQGIQLDSNGNQVIVGGKPVLTTIVGVKEETSTRIGPILMLNGRIWRPAGNFIDGVHLSLGITAKNDNKGTDIDFLVGPSISMADEQLFLTFGGYAGRKQQLEGNLFQGAVVPEGTAELPVHKSYRWSVGISLSYRIK
jgi:hypothetical protein